MKWFRSYLLLFQALLIVTHCDKNIYFLDLQKLTTDQPKEEEEEDDDDDDEGGDLSKYNLDDEVSIKK